MRPRDTQAKKVYRWESPFVDKMKSSLDLAECEALAAKACRMFNVPAPRIKDGRGCRDARGGRHHLTLPRWARSPGIVIHEAAHCIAEWVWGYRNVPWHGKEFVGLFMYLLARLNGCDPGEMCRRANEMNVDFIAAGKIKELMKARR